MGHLYKLDFASGKSYIGQSIRAPQQRFADHARSAKGEDLLLYRAWRKHGKPKLTVLAFIEDRLLDETEIRAISVYGTLTPGGYNMLPGGHLSSGMLGRTHSEDACNKMSASQTNRYEKMSAEERKNAASPITEETCRKMSASHLGIKRESHSEYMKLWWKNRTSEQLNARNSKISEAMKMSHASGSRKPRRDSKPV